MHASAAGAAGRTSIHARGVLPASASGDDDPDDASAGNFDRPGDSSAATRPRIACVLGLLTPAASNECRGSDAGAPPAAPNARGESPPAPN